MTTKKELKKEIEALKAQLALKDEQLKKTEWSANSTHLYREHCVEQWLEGEKTIEALEKENADLKARNRKLVRALKLIESFLVEKGIYNPINEIEMEVR